MGGDGEWQVQVCLGLGAQCILQGPENQMVLRVYGPGGCNFGRLQTVEGDVVRLPPEVVRPVPDECRSEGGIRQVHRPPDILDYNEVTGRFLPRHRVAGRGGHEATDPETRSCCEIPSLRRNVSGGPGGAPTSPTSTWGGWDYGWPDGLRPCRGSPEGGRDSSLRPPRDWLRDERGDGGDGGDHMTDEDLLQVLEDMV